MKDVRQINTVFVDLDECKEINDTLKVIITKYDLAYVKLDSALKFKKFECLKKDSMITSYTNIVSDQEKLIKKRDRKIRMLKIQRNILAPTLGVLVLLLFII
jgi:aminoglycoside phosphotransferase family enzyme